MTFPLRSKVVPPTQLMLWWKLNKAETIKSGEKLIAQGLRRNKAFCIWVEYEGQINEVPGKGIAVVEEVAVNTVSLGLGTRSYDACGDGSRQFLVMAAAAVIELASQLYQRSWPAMWHQTINAGNSNGDRAVTRKLFNKYFINSSFSTDHISGIMFSS